jgi:hypothetical protein
MVCQNTATIRVMVVGWPLPACVEEHPGGGSAGSFVTEKPANAITASNPKAAIKIAAEVTIAMVLTATVETMSISPVYIGSYTRSIY